MIYFQGLDGMRTDLNRVVYDLTGVSGDELKQNPNLWDELIHPDDAAARKKYLDEHPDGVKYHALDYRLKNKQGEWCWIQSRWTRARDVSGNVIGYYCIDRDITAQKQTLESLKESERKVP